MSGVTTFLLRLVGADPEQKETQRQFRESLKKVDEVDGKLNDILGDINRINRKAKKNREVTRTIVPMKTRTDPTPVPGSSTG